MAVVTSALLLRVMVGGRMENQSIVFPLSTELAGSIGVSDASDPDASESWTSTKLMFFVAPALKVKKTVDPGVLERSERSAPEAPCKVAVPLTVVV